MRNGDKTYFLFAVMLTFIRELNVPVLGEVTPATLMFMLLLCNQILRSLIVLKTWVAYLLVLIISFLIGMLTVEVERVIMWTVPLWDVMAIAALTPMYIRSHEDLANFTKCILSVAFIFSITTIMAYHGYYDGVVIVSLTDVDVVQTSRVYGITFSNIVQAISVITICLLPHVDINKYIKYALILIFVYAALVTLKRLSFIAIFLSLFYYCFIEVRNKNYLSLSIVAIAVVFIILNWWDFLFARFNIFTDTTVVTITERSAQTRVDRVNYALNSFWTSPIWGKGAGNNVYIHNGILEVAANCGLLGLFAIIGRYLVPLKGLFKLNPWSAAVCIYFITCFSLEAAMSRSQLMYFLGLFIGGYTVSKNLNIDYKNIKNE